MNNNTTNILNNNINSNNNVMNINSNNNDTKKDNNEKDISTLKIVVAQYNEDTSWLWKYERFTIIYNKSKPILHNPYVMNLPNVGREGHTYLNYIITNWDNLPDKIFFTQGNIKDHNTFLLEKYLFSLEPFVINLNCNKTNCYKMWGHVMFNDDTVRKLVVKSQFTYGEWWDRFINKQKPSFNDFKWSAGSIFSVSKNNIYKNSKEYYVNLINTLSYCNNPEEGHYLERSWYYIFS